MCFDTVFEVWPNCLLALLTVLAMDFASKSGRLGLPIERGTVTPRTLLRRARFFSARPPATPAAAAPTASAGPLALLAACLTVPTTPFSLWLFAELRFPPLLLEREEPVFEREALLRAPVEDADVFERDEPLRPLPARGDPLAFVLEPELFEELVLVRPLREADLLLDIVILWSRRFPCALRYPLRYADNRNLLCFRNAYLKGSQMGTYMQCLTHRLATPRSFGSSTRPTRRRSSSRSRCRRT